MNLNAKQVSSIDYHSKMDTTTVLSFFNQMDKVIRANKAVQTALDQAYINFMNALIAFNSAFAQIKKWIQTQDIEELDKQRDASLRAFVAAIKAMLNAPTDEMKQAARKIDNVAAKYDLKAEAEYMKETETIAQMVEEMERNYQIELALKATNLTAWLADLKAKNQAFLAKMNERTEAQSYQQKGIVRQTRLQTEAEYKTMIKVLNALAIVDATEGADFDYFIDQMNSEIDHYKRILAQKKGGSSKGEDDPTPVEPENKDEGE